MFSHPYIQSTVLPYCVIALFSNRFVVVYNYYLSDKQIISYIPGPSTFTFNAAGTQVYPVAIVNDKGVEPVEEFILILSNPQPAAVLLDPGSFIISITDDDG